MRNLVPVSCRRWRIPLAPDVGSHDEMGDERIVASCFDGEARVVYAVTTACTLYGVSVASEASGPNDDASDIITLEVSLLAGGFGGPGGDDEDDDGGPALACRSEIVGMEYVVELGGVCIAAASGELIVVAPPEADGAAASLATTMRGARAGAAAVVPECVGVVASGLRAMRWNPDGEVLVLATGAGTLICMTKDFFPLAEVSVPDARAESSAAVGAALSWRGDGQFVASLVPSAVEGAGPVLQVWGREDLELHSTGEKTLSPLASGPRERGADGFPPSPPPLAWQPRGALIAAACDGSNPGRGGSPSEVVFFERNGLRRGGFALPSTSAASAVASLTWSFDSSLLAVVVSSPSSTSDTDTIGVQVWTRGNMHWYLKRELRYASAREGGSVWVEWDDAAHHTLRVVSAAGTVEEHAFAWDTRVSPAATAAVVDGQHLRITPLARTPLPPPMAAAIAAFPAPVSEVAWLPPPPPPPGSFVISDAPEGERALALLADGRLAVVSSSRGTEWEETAEALAEEDDECEPGTDAVLDGGVVAGSDPRELLRGVPGVIDAEEADAAGARLRHLAWISRRAALVTLDGLGTSSVLLLLHLEGPSSGAGEGRLRDRDVGWSVTLEAFVELPAPATCVTPVEGTGSKHHGAFVQLQATGGRGGAAPKPSPPLWVNVQVNVNVVCERGKDGGGLSCRKVDEGMSLEVTPATWPTAALPEPCAVARTLPPMGLLGGANGDIHSPSLVGLDGRGTLRCGSRTVASNVRSFAVHWSAPGGVVATGPTAPDVSFAAAGAAAAAWDGASSSSGSPRIVYVTLADDLRVAELPDLAGRSTSAAPGSLRSPAAGDDVSVGWKGPSATATAAGGRRRGGAGGDPNGITASTGLHGKDVYMDQLHVSMRAAMRPADAAKAVDSRVRRVEEGARIVASPPAGLGVVLQMPRGNLETVAPRFLALPSVAAALRSERFGDAASLAMRHRIDMNLLVDDDRRRFVSRADAFVASVDDPDVIMELVEVLEERDTTAPGGVYAHLPKEKATAVGGGDEAAPTGDETCGKGKVSEVCAALRAAVLRRRGGSDLGDGGAPPEDLTEVSNGLLADRWELVVLSTYARDEPPDLHAALTRVSSRRRAELAAASSSSAAPKDVATGLDAGTALKHLLTLMGGDALYAAALGTYDLSMAYLVGQHAQMDPGEFVPDLQRLQELSEPLRKADIDRRLGRHARCIEHLLLGGDVAGACEVADRRRLFPHALAAAAALGDQKEAHVDVARAYAAQLARERRHEDAAVALLTAGDAAGALEHYRAALAWRPALALAARLGLPPRERRAIAEALAEGMELTDPGAAAAVAAQHLGDVDRALGLLCKAREWREGSRVAYLHDRGDLVETTLAPAAAEAASEILAEAREAPGRAAKYLARLRDLKRHREALARAVEAGEEAWRAAGGLGGRPGGAEDDGASEAPSLASGMSAYTDRTLGAQTVTTASGISRVPSTQGGRKPKKPSRKERRGKKAGLRAGGPTEERDLAAHLAGGGVAAQLLLPRALEEIGELSEILVTLGHAGDAASLQRAVAAAMEAHEAAAAEAKACLAALDAANTAAAGDEGAERKPTEAGSSGAGAAGAAGSGTATTAQWKWAVLRGSNADGADEQ